MTSKQAVPAPSALAISRVPGLQVFHVAPGRCVFACLDRVALQIWLAPAQGADGEALAGFAAKMRAKHPAGMSAIHWIQPGIGLPTPEARVHFRAIGDTLGDWVGETMIVLDGDGFWVGALRSMLTGLRIATRSAMKYRVVASMEEALAVLALPHQERTGQCLEPARVMSAFDALYLANR